MPLRRRLEPVRRLELVHSRGRYGYVAKYRWVPPMRVRSAVRPRRESVNLIALFHPEGRRRRGKAVH
jgi:hypothetical protein